MAENGTAVRVTQVYTEATHSVTIGVGIVSIAVLVAVIGILFFTNKPIKADKQIEDNYDTQLTDNPVPETSSSP